MSAQQAFGAPEGERSKKRLRADGQEGDESVEAVECPPWARALLTAQAAAAAQSLAKLEASRAETHAQLAAMQAQRDGGYAC